MTSKRVKAPRPGLTRGDIATFEKVDGQLRGLHTEIQTLVKKSPNDSLNPFKLRLVNTVLRASDALLSDAYRPFLDFTGFEDEALPSNSDVMLILAQYIGALEQMRADNIVKGYGTWYWRVDGQESDIQTAPPLKISRK